MYKSFIVFLLFNLFLVQRLFAETEVLPNMFFLKGGDFFIGDTKEQKCPKSIYLSDFYISKYEVTVAEYKEFIDSTGYITSADSNGYSWIIQNGSIDASKGVNWSCDESGLKRLKKEFDYPVIHVSWYDAVEYCKWRSQVTGKIIRLPTEAEWEYACKGGRTSIDFYSGIIGTERCQYGNFPDYTAMGVWAMKFSSIDCIDGYEYSSPVGQFKPNNIDLYDMVGNVWEWCSDWYNSRFKSGENPIGKRRGRLKVKRGVSWFSILGYETVNELGMSSIKRSKVKPERYFFDIGFRIVMEP